MKLISKFLLVAFLATSFMATAQDEETGALSFSGSVDTYFKYDFADTSNIETSFAGDHNSFSLGMVNLIASHTLGKATFVGDVSFGPRGQTQSIPDEAAAGGSFNIQNLFVSYDITDELSISAGYMGTFVGYELISPTGNFNYSTSRLFTNGPFQNAGVRVKYTFSEKFALMVGAFNEWNTYSDADGIDDFGAQVYVSPVDGLDMYLNVATNSAIDQNEFDLTGAYTISDAFKLGFNAAILTETFTGVALYPQFSFSETAALGLRYEYFAWEEGTAYNSVTLSGNFVAGNLTFIPEIRLDAADEDVFSDSKGIAIPNASSATQFMLAAVYSF